MKKDVIPFIQKSYSNVDPIVLDQLAVETANVYLDDLGYLVSRPGLTLRNRLGSNHPSCGMYWWERLNVIVTASDGRLFTEDEFGNITELTNTDLLEPNQRIVCADNGDYLVVCNGGRMLYTQGAAGDAQYVSDSDAPDQVSYVAFLDNYILANQIGTGRFYYAVFTGAPTDWNPVDVYSAEYNPDNIIALWVQNNYITIVGTQSIEFWVDDGVSPFTRLGGGALSRGGMSPYSSLLVNEDFYFFDFRRRFCRLDGLQPVTLSTPYDRLFQTLTNVEDCFMYYNTVIGRNWIDIFFPTDGVSFRYDIQLDTWYVLSTFNSALGEAQMFIGNSYCYARNWNKHILGSWQTDKIYEMAEAYTDDAGTPIIANYISGFLDKGIPAQKKRCYRLDLRIKTGEGIGPTHDDVPYARFRYQDVLKDGTLVWSNWRYIPLNQEGDRGFLVTIRDLGSYWIRQYQIQNANPIKFIVGKVTEGYDVQLF